MKRSRNIVALSEYALEPLRKDEAFILYRARDRNQADTASVLLLMPVLRHPALETLKKIEHEYAFRNELDATWAVRPLAVSQYNEERVLVLEDQGGEPLNRFTQGPMEMRQFFGFAISLTTVLSQLHKRDLIHKVLKPSNVLVHSMTGQVWLTGFGSLRALRRNCSPPNLLNSSLSKWR